MAAAALGTEAEQGKAKAKAGPEEGGADLEADCGSEGIEKGTRGGGGVGSSPVVGLFLQDTSLAWGLPRSGGLAAGGLLALGRQEGRASLLRGGWWGGPLAL